MEWAGLDGKWDLRPIENKGFWSGHLSWMVVVPSSRKLAVSLGWQRTMSSLLDVLQTSSGIVQETGGHAALELRGGIWVKTWHECFLLRGSGGSLENWRHGLETKYRMKREERPRTYPWERPTFKRVIEDEKLGRRWRQEQPERMKEIQEFRISRDHERPCSKDGVISCFKQEVKWWKVPNWT